MQYLKGKMSENLVFFLTRLGSQNENLITSLLNYIQQEKYIETGEVRDHITLLNLANNFKI